MLADTLSCEIFGSVRGKPGRLCAKLLPQCGRTLPFRCLAVGLLAGASLYGILVAPRLWCEGPSYHVRRIRIADVRWPQALGCHLLWLMELLAGHSPYPSHQDSAFWFKLILAKSSTGYSKFSSSACLAGPSRPCFHSREFLSSANRRCWALLWVCLSRQVGTSWNNLEQVLLLTELHPTMVERVSGAGISLFCHQERWGCRGPFLLFRFAFAPISYNFLFQETSSWTESFAQVVFPDKSSSPVLKPRSASGTSLLDCRVASCCGFKVQLPGQSGAKCIPHRATLTSLFLAPAVICNILQCTCISGKHSYT